MNGRKGERLPGTDFDKEGRLLGIEVLKAGPTTTNPHSSSLHGEELSSDTSLPSSIAGGRLVLPHCRDSLRGRAPQVTWRPADQVDEEMRRWMKAKGWEVTDVDYHFDQGVYSWRHVPPGGKSPTLRIERYILERYPAFVLLHHPNELKVARTIKVDPGASLVVREKGTAIVLEEIPAE